MSASERRPREFEVEIAPELEGGTYANFVTVWYTPHDFTLDFSAMQSGEIDDPDDPASPEIIRCPVVTRVRIPATFVFDVIRAVNTEMTNYEREFGEIRRPEEGGR